MLGKLASALGGQFLFDRARTHAAHRVGRLHASGGWALVGIHEFLDGHGDFAAIHAKILAGRRVKPHQHQLHQDLRVDHDARTFGGSNPSLVLGKTLAEVLVGRVLVAQAAHQPPAATGNLQRIKGGLLDLGRTHGDRLENLEEVLAAAVLAATLVIRDQPSLVARADLAHLDPAAELAGKRLGEVAEINALVAQVIHHQERLVEGELEVNDLGGELAVRGHFAHATKAGARLVIARRRGVEILDRSNAQHFAVGLERILAAAGVLDVVQHLRPRNTLAAARIRASQREHLRDLDGAESPHHQLRSAARLRVAAIRILADQLHPPELHDDRCRRLQARVGLFVGQLGAEFGVRVSLKHGKRKDRHKTRSVANTRDPPTLSIREG